MGRLCWFLFSEINVNMDKLLLDACYGPCVYPICLFQPVDYSTNKHDGQQSCSNYVFVYCVYGTYNCESESLILNNLDICH